MLVVYGMQVIARYRQGACGAPGARRGGLVNGVEGLIGNTPLMRIRSLSELTGCEACAFCCYSSSCCVLEN